MQPTTSRVSDYYRLDRDQAALDFIDVDVRGDTPMYVDPRALRLIEDDWSNECVSLLQDYFSTVIAAIGVGDRPAALRLLGALREPNETHLGESRGKAKGSGIGPGFAKAVYAALSNSAAVRTGLLQDLEETVLLIDGIDRDRVSDITTNVIRGPLIAYTQHIAQEYGIPLSPGIVSGPIWDPSRRIWHQEYVRLPRTVYGRILLVPKAIVRRKLIMNANDFQRDFVLPYLEGVELAAGSELVETLKSGTKRVTKKALRAKYGTGKALNRKVVQDHPQLLSQYREKQSGVLITPLTHEQVAHESEQQEPDWPQLLNRVCEVERGPSAATQYHRAAQDLLTALLYPSLVHPVREKEINEGRKRVDIRYTNAASTGFFSWVAQHYGAPYVMVECKNYTGDPANPELDQLAGRFSLTRGQVGILACRGSSSPQAKDRFISGCRDTANDGRGFIILLDDQDLAQLVELRQIQQPDGAERLLRQRFDRLL